MSAAFVQNDVIVLILVNELEHEVLTCALLDYYDANKIAKIVEAKVAITIADRIQEAVYHGEVL